MGVNTIDTDTILRSARACPFATLEDGDKHELSMSSDVDKRYNIDCKCGARSPDADTPLNAVTRWNRRYADDIHANTERSVGKIAVKAQREVEAIEKKFAAMQVENNALLERARTAEAALELTTHLAERAARDHG